ncbi:MAG TPA: magnesium protoporphyrin IX methyltransferase [Rubrivivax sp.]
MTSDSRYLDRRGQIQTYFDRTAVQAWERLTSTAPVGRIRASVRAGRDRMRDTLLGWLPADLSGARLLDAGCGTGALAVAAARRGADVLAIDLSPTLVGIARDRVPTSLGRGHIDFRAGDMLDPALGHFDYVVGMDSVIHYQPDDAVKVLAGLAPRTSTAMLFTFAPLTPPLAVMLALGKLLPRGERSPAIVPVAARKLQQRIADEPSMAGWTARRTERVQGGFYTSQALEMVRK